MIFKGNCVVWNLHSEVEKVLVDRGPLDTIFWDLAGRWCVVTSVRDEGHGKNSFHYYGRAIDVRTNDMPYDKTLEAERLMKNILGPQWRVELEHMTQDHEHIHAEYRGP